MTEELWREMRRLDGNQAETAREVAGHVGTCDARHAEIQRRFEAADKSRGDMRAEFARELARQELKVDALNARVLGVLITVALTALGVLGQIVLRAARVIN